MKPTNINVYKELLNDLKFDELNIELSKVPFIKMEDILHQLAYDKSTGEGNLLVYSFLTMLIEKEDSTRLHLLTSSLMGTTLNFITMAENIGLYHGMRALALDPENVDIMEFLLYFNHIPEKILNDSTASEFAKKILEKNPNSMAARITPLI